MKSKKIFYLIFITIFLNFTIVRQQSLVSSQQSVVQYEKTTGFNLNSGISNLRFHTIDCNNYDALIQFYLNKDVSNSIRYTYNCIISIDIKKIFIEKKITTTIGNRYSNSLLELENIHVDCPIGYLLHSFKYNQIGTYVKKTMFDITAENIRYSNISADVN